MGTRRACSPSVSGTSALDRHDPATIASRFSSRSCWRHGDRGIRSSAAPDADRVDSALADTRAHKQPTRPSDTYLRATLLYVERRNITLSLPSTLVKQVKIVAAKRETSVSALLAASLEEIVRGDDSQRADATQRILNRARRGFDLGTGGRIPLSRDVLHER
jgi:hypothetical protein